jgi:hypothetical protein
MRQSREPRTSMPTGVYLPSLTLGHFRTPTNIKRMAAYHRPTGSSREAGVRYRATCDAPVPRQDDCFLRLGDLAVATFSDGGAPIPAVRRPRVKESNRPVSAVAQVERGLLIGLAAPICV